MGQNSKGNKKISLSKKALMWWHNLSIVEKIEYKNTLFDKRSYRKLTTDQIIQLYKSKNKSYEKSRASSC
jgi:hypothetical protein